MPPKSLNSTLVAFVALASRTVDPDSVAPFEGRTMVVVGTATETVLENPLENG
jgi:hypothetical protein